MSPERIFALAYDAALDGGAYTGPMSNETVVNAAHAGYAAGARVRRTLEAPADDHAARDLPLM